MKKWTNKEEQWLKDNYQIKGRSFCIEYLCINKRQLDWKVSELRLKLPKEIKNVKQIYIKGDAQYSVNAEFFTLPQTKEACYLLGFWWADGHIRHSDEKNKTRSSVVLKCCSEDVQKIKHIIDLSGKWCFRLDKSKSKYNTRPTTIVETSNRILTKFLYDNDYKIKGGASASKILSHIPLEFRSYFFLGLSDGDGSFVPCKDQRGGCFSLASSYDQDWQYVTDELGKRGIKYSIKKRIMPTGRNSCVLVTGMRNHFKLHSFLYPNGFEFGLKRKYDKSILCCG